MRYGIVITMVFALLFFPLLNGCGEGDIDHDSYDPDVVWESSSYNSGSWNDRIRDMAIRSSKAIPKGVGAIVSLLLDIFWPKNDPDIWAKIMADVQKSMDRAITAQVISQRKSELDGLTRNIRSYTRTQNLTEKGNYLTVCLAKSAELFCEITQDKIHDAQLAPIATSLATIHISLLRERYEYGDKLYPQFANKDAMWLEELLEYYDEYILYFYGYDRDGNKVVPSLLDRWEIFRNKLLVDTYWTEAGIPPTSSAMLKDEHYSLDEPYAIYTAPHQKVDWHIPVAQAKLWIMTHEKLMFADEVMACVAVLCRMLPEGSHPDAAGLNSFRVNPDLQQLVVGPVAWHTVKSIKPKQNYPESVDDPKWVIHNENQPGTLKRVYVRAWNAVDGLQFEFSDGYTGPLIGNKDGGKLYDQYIRSEGDYFSGFGLSISYPAAEKWSHIGDFKFYTSNAETGWVAPYRGTSGPGLVVRAQNYEVVGAGFKYSTRQLQFGNIKCIYLWFNFRNPPAEEPKHADSSAGGE